MTASPFCEGAARAVEADETAELAACVGEAIVDAIARDRVVIPPFPGVALQVQEVLKKENYALAELSEVVEKDQALVAAVLRTANSTFYGGARKVSSLSAAIARIGATQLSRVVVAASLGSAASRAGPLFPVRSAVWRDSLLSAHLCQTLARARGIDGEAAFLCGMLHDFGSALALACAEDFLTAWPDPTPMPIEFWTAVADAHHVALGRRLVERWGLADALRDAIELHHQPVDDGTAGLVGLVCASDAVIGFLAHEQAPATEDFARLPFVGGLREGKLIATAIDDILAAVAAFTVEQRSGAGRSRVAAVATTLSGAARDVSFPVRVLGTDGTHTYVAHKMTGSGLAFVGSGVLPTNTLVRLELQATAHKATIWANVTLCASEKGKWRIEVVPVAMGAADKKAWNDIFGGVDRPAPAAPAPPLRVVEAPPAPLPVRSPAAPAEAPGGEKGWWKKW